MIREINYAGAKIPVDFNIMTLVRIAKVYDTDVTGLSEVFAQLSDCESSLMFVANVGAIALTEGSRRAEGVEYRKYTVDDVLDMMTVDMTITEQLTSTLFDTMRGSTVFQKAATQQMPPRSKKRKKSARVTSNE